MWANKTEVKGNEKEKRRKKKPTSYWNRSVTSLWRYRTPFSSYLSVFFFFTFIHSSRLFYIFFHFNHKKFSNTSTTFALLHTIDKFLSSRKNSFTRASFVYFICPLFGGSFSRFFFFERTQKSGWQWNVNFSRQNCIHFYLFKNAVRIKKYAVYGYRRVALSFLTLFSQFFFPPALFFSCMSFTAVSISQIVEASQVSRFFENKI